MIRFFINSPVSNESDLYGNDMASPVWKLTFWAKFLFFANSIWASEGSIPYNSLGKHFSMICEENAPLPQPKFIKVALYIF